MSTLSPDIKSNKAKMMEGHSRQSNALASCAQVNGTAVKASADWEISLTHLAVNDSYVPDFVNHTTSGRLRTCQ